MPQIPASFPIPSNLKLNVPVAEVSLYQEDKSRKGLNFTFPPKSSHTPQIMLKSGSDELKEVENQLRRQTAVTKLWYDISDQQKIDYITSTLGGLIGNNFCPSGSDLKAYEVFDDSQGYPIKIDASVLVGSFFYGHTILPQFSILIECNRV